jgi:hypothetical protein
MGHGMNECAVCGRIAADVSWIDTALSPPRWLCTDINACHDAWSATRPPDQLPQ